MEAKHASFILTYFFNHKGRALDENIDNMLQT